RDERQIREPVVELASEDRERVDRPATAHLAPTELEAAARRTHQAREAAYEVAVVAVLHDEAMLPGRVPVPAVPVGRDRQWPVRGAGRLHGRRAHTGAPASPSALVGAGVPAVTRQTSAPSTCRVDVPRIWRVASITW